MSLTFETPDDLADFLPAPPRFSPTSDEWIQVGRLAELLDLTDTGLMRIRKRLRHRYEQKHKNNTYVYGRYWLRLWAIDQSKN